MTLMSSSRRNADAAVQTAVHMVPASVTHDITHANRLVHTDRTHVYTRPQMRTLRLLVFAPAAVHQADDSRRV